jgi:hypothetical protein
MGEQRAVTMWRRKDTHRDNPVTMEERNSLMGEQATATIQGQLSRIDRPESRRRLIPTTVDWLWPFFPLRPAIKQH